MVKTLSTLGLTKGGAKNIAKSLAKKNMLKLKSLCIFVLVLIVVFSISVGFSTSIYAGLYWTMIPSDIVREHEVFFTYKPIDAIQKNLIKE